MTDKEKIRAEIERLKEHIGIGLNAYDAGYENGRFELCNDLLFFIDSLPEEKPSKDLEEAGEEYAYSWRKEGNKEVRELFPKAAYRAFIAGAERQKRKMMEGAVDGSVKWAYNDELVSIHYDDPVEATMCYFAKRNGLNVGDKVKIIILPNE